MCLAVTKFILRKINFGVWFLQTFLQKMLYMPNFPHTSSTVNMQIMNQFHNHSQEKQNPAKKFIKSVQARSEEKIGAAEENMRSRGPWRDRWRDRCDRPTRGAIDERTRRTIAPLFDRRARSQSRSSDERARQTIAVLFLLARRTIAPALSSSSLSLRSGLSLLSLSLSLSLFPEMIWSENEGGKSFRVKGENIGQPEVIFRKKSFSVTAKHAGLGENDFLKSFSPKTNAPLVEIDG